MKIISLIISVLILLSILISCSADTFESDKTETVSESESIDIEPEINDYGGYTFRIGAKESEATNIYTFVSDGLDGEPINDAIYNRNRTIEDKYNINIVQNDITSLNNSIMAGSDDFDIVCQNSIASTVQTLITNNMIMDFNSTDINLSSPWFDQNANAQAELYGNLYTVFSDFTYGLYDSIIVLGFVKDLMTDFNSDINLYEYVKEKKWTVDVFNQVISKVSMDLNGDGVMDSSDQWGTVGGKVTANALYTGFGNSFVSKKGDDYEFTLVTETPFDKIEKITDIMYNQENFQITENLRLAAGESTVWTASEKLFTEGRMLFRSSLIFDLRGYREMELDFGIIPYPLYDENQDQYYTYPHFAITRPNAVIIPVTVQDVNCSVNVFDALAYTSSTTVKSAYYEISVQGKTTRDSESVEMLDIIFNNVIIDPGIFYNINNILSFLPNYVAEGKTEITSAIETIREQSIIKLNEFMGLVKNK